MRWIAVFIAIFNGAAFGEGVDYTKYFEPNGALRVDFFLSGNAQGQTAYFDAVYSDAVWGGNPTNTIEPFSYGEYCFRVFDKETNTLIYSKGFSSLF